MSLLRDLWRVVRRQRRWMPREKWDALIAEVGCPICPEVDCPENDFSFLVARLEVSNLRLVRNQYVRGYCALVTRAHAVELDELPAEQRDALLRDLVRAGGAVRRVFRPDKMNYELLGNVTPHLHWHIVPRYWGDPAPGRPIEALEGGKRLLEPEEYRRLIEQLQVELGAKKTPG